MIIKTEAIVLHAMKYRDTSRIVRLCTREYGKVSAIAKGARGPKSKFGAALEPMSHVLAVMYKKDNRELQLLTQCDTIRSMQRLVDDAEKLSTALSIIELTDHATQATEENEALFALLLETLEATNNAAKNARNALLYFELRLAEILGFKPEFLRCTSCSTLLEAGATTNSGESFGLGMSGALCRSCAHHAVSYESMQSASLSVLQSLGKAVSAEAAINVNLTGDVQAEVGRTLWQHLRRHVHGLTKLKSEHVFAQMV
jgi:DNA repair protein RecO (recombination protein O)